MIYELTQDGYRIGYYPTEAEARRHADYMPKGCYTLRQWRIEGNFLIFDAHENTMYQFKN